MLKPSEELLQFIWQHKLLKPGRLISTDGYELVVLHPGTLNRDAGPDFFNARIQINGLVLAGNIELHLRTSDWLRHRHQDDTTYDNLILHVVFQHDADIEQNTRFHVPVLEIHDLVGEDTIRAYTHLAEAADGLPCTRQLAGVNDHAFNFWIERMTIERLEEKMKKVVQLFGQYQCDYTQTFYVLLLTAFGLKVNATPFALLAGQLPASILLRHANDLLVLESLLLGVAGMLEEPAADPHSKLLQNEFVFLKRKYQLAPLHHSLFKFSRIRPANFPDLRLKQFAQMVHGSEAILTSPYQFTTLKAITRELMKEPEGQPCHMGLAAAENIVINAFVPFFFFYAKKTGKSEYGQLALGLLAQCHMEWNHKTRLFDVKKQVLTNAAASQGLLNLYDRYCLGKQCLKCGIAAAILKPAGSSPVASNSVSLPHDR